jgi:hypothetical protein
VNRSILTVFAAAVCLSVAGAVSAAPAPKIVCEAPEFNFGSRDNTETVEHDFLIRNDGDLTLDIRAARSSCGCTVANISSKLVEPGRSTVITAKLSLEAREGPQHKIITLESNDPATPQLVLSMIGEAMPAVVVEPRTLVNPSLIQGRHLTTNIITVTAQDKTPLKILGIESDNPHVEAVEVPAGDPQRAAIEIRTRETLPKGSTFGKVSIRTDHPKKPIITVPFRFTIIGEIVVFPQELNILEQKQALTRIVTLGPGSVQDFRVTSVEVPDKKIKAQIQDLRNSRYRVVLTNLTPSTDLNGASIRILTTAQNMETVEIPFRIIPRK